MSLQMEASLKIKNKLKYIRIKNKINKYINKTVRIFIYTKQNMHYVIKTTFIMLRLYSYN